MIDTPSTYSYDESGSNAHDKLHSHTDPWNDSGDELYGRYSEPEPDIVDVYREMLNTPGIDEDQAEFLETRINDILER